MNIVNIEIVGMINRDTCFKNVFKNGQFQASFNSRLINTTSSLQKSADDWIRTVDLWRLGSQPEFGPWQRLLDLNQF